jgi:hypothetical protein
VTRRLLVIGAGVVLAIILIVAGAVYWALSGDAVRTTLEQQASAWAGQPVRIGSARAALFPRVALRLQDVRVGEPARLTLARVDLSTSLRALLARRIDDADVLVADSRIEMPLPIAIPTAAAPPASPAAGAAAIAAGGVTVSSIRAIALRDITVASRGREITLSADSALNGNRLTIASISARAGDTAIDARGHVDLAPRVVATIEATAQQLDVDDLLAVAAAFTSGNSGASTAKPAAKINATITAPNARLAGLALARFEAGLLADGAELRIEPLKFDIFAGRYDGWLDVRFGEALDVRVGAGVSNVDVAQLAAFGGAADTITGKLYATGRFAARGRDMAAVLAAARGVGEASISAGSIRRLDLVRTVVLFFGRPGAKAPPEAGEKFESITANFALADRSLRSDNLTLRSPDFDVFARSTLALPTQALDGRADIVLSEALSSQAGRDLYRFTRSGNRVVLPATIGGTLGQPTVSIDAGAAIRRGIQNEIEGKLKDLLEQVVPKLP